VAAAPVRGIGRLAIWLETFYRRLLGQRDWPGLCAALSTYVAIGAAAWGTIRLAAAVHPLAADVVSILISTRRSPRGIWHGTAWRSIAAWLPATLLNRGGASVRSSGVTRPSSTNPA